MITAILILISCSLQVWVLAANTKPSRVLTVAFPESAGINEVYPDGTIKNFDYNTLKGKRIGVLSIAASKIERLEEFLDFNKNNTLSGNR